MSTRISLEAFLLPLLLGVSLVITACGGQMPQPKEDPHAPKSDGTEVAGTTSAAPSVESSTETDATLPVLSLEYRGDVIEGHRGRTCWKPPDREKRECLAEGKCQDVDTHTEVSSNETLTILVEADAPPTRMSVYSLSEPGEVSGDFIRLHGGQSSFVLDEGPGSYKVRVTAQWSEEDVEVSYGFGLRIPGEPELKSECASTAIGGILGIVLESPDDPHRTAVEAINHRGCRFNKRIAKVRLVLEGDAGLQYTETFHLEPPSLNVQFPVPEDVSSVREGGPLPPGEYSRRIVVVADDGTEDDLDLDDIGGIVKLVDELPETDAPIEFPQHPDRRQTYTTALPEHIEGRLQAYRGCIYIRNGHIPVWSSDFSLRVEGGVIQVLDESGNVVGVDGKKAVLAGYEVRADDPAGREISATLPLACPPGNFWIVGDEIGELKESARLTIVPLEGSTLIFHRQSPGLWSDELSISTGGDLVHEGDCLRINDAEGHMIIWPPLFTPHMRNGVVEIRDGDGVAVARIGDRLEMTGFGSELMRPHYADRCPGPYWTVGRITERR